MKPKPPTNNTFTQTHASLAPLLAILSAFAHRNHNQHKASHWWSAFNLLRRTLPKFDAALISGHDASIRDHARWMSSHVVPRAYVAFTQLAADNQHAPLGLMLVAVLARVHTLLSDLMPSELAFKPAAAIAEPASLGDEPSLSVDRGVAISRHELVSAEETRAPDAPGESDNPQPNKVESWGMPKEGNVREGKMKEGKVKERKAKGRRANQGPTKDRKWKKKKRGDELSSLFSSLA
ncbi:Fc.00g006620.m01.CDS01 [Cosmosporella sp. VM-42]